MKKAIKQALATIAAIPVLVLFAIVLIFVVPVDFIKYKRSLYYKKYRKKYTLFAAAAVAFRLYNEILKQDLPIRFYENPNDPDLACGWFVLEDTLIIINEFHFEFDATSGTWKYCDEEDGAEAWLSLEEYIENEINDANELTGQMICKDAVVLTDEISVDDLQKAKEDTRFLIYDDLAEAVKQFCKIRKEESQ